MFLGFRWQNIWLCDKITKNSVCNRQECDILNDYTSWLHAWLCTPLQTKFLKLKVMTNDRYTSNYYFLFAKLAFCVSKITTTKLNKMKSDISLNTASIKPVPHHQLTPSLWILVTAKWSVSSETLGTKQMSCGQALTCNRYMSLKLRYLMHTATTGKFKI